MIGHSRIRKNASPRPRGCLREEGLAVPLRAGAVLDDAARSSVRSADGARYGGRHHVKPLPAGWCRVVQVDRDVLPNLAAGPSGASICIASTSVNRRRSEAAAFEHLAQKHTAARAHGDRVAMEHPQVLFISGRQMELWTYAHGLDTRRDTALLAKSTASRSGVDVIPNDTPPTRAVWPTTRL